MKKQLPKVLDEALFDKDTYRRKQESFLSYTMRRQYQWDALEKQGWTIPDEPKAYLLRKCANLSDKQQELIELWTKSEYNYSEMESMLKRLDMPSHGGHYAGRVVAGFQHDEDHGAFDEESSEQESTEEIPKSLYVSPESFDDEAL